MTKGQLVTKEELEKELDQVVDTLDCVADSILALKAQIDELTRRFNDQ